MRKSRRLRQRGEQPAMKQATGYETTRQNAVDTRAMRNDRQKSSQVTGSPSAFRPSAEKPASASTAVGITRKTTSHAVGGTRSARKRPFIGGAPARPRGATRPPPSRPP